MSNKRKMNSIALTLSALGAAGLVAHSASADPRSPTAISFVEVSHAAELGDKDEGHPGDDKGKDKDKDAKKKKTAKKGKKKKDGSCGAKGGCGAGTCG